ncbi:MAG: glutamate synthase subunit beta [Bacteroidia bacterium]|nr:glutamate synthase subunit beta [Bacteroidia bacterium]
MGKPTGFLEYNRELPQTRATKERLKDFKELYLPFSEEKTREQAARCMDCGVPFCHQGCPLGNHIPDFNDAVYREDWDTAVDILLSTNPFPEFTGRICPAPCEGSCVLGINRPPVSIELIEKTIIEKAFERGYIKPQPPRERTDKSVAVVGSGPAGLAAAVYLNRAGHNVTVYERESNPGGLLRYGIPDFKLEKWVVERRIRILEAEGIRFVCNAHIGVDVPTDELKSYDSIVVTGGSTVPRDLNNTAGRNLKGVHFAMDFLTRQNKKVSGEWVTPYEDITAKGKHVVVIGGGDTGADCVGTSNRQGALSITQLEVMGKPPEGRDNSNPWPEWPMILRTSSSHEEGCERQWSVLTKEFVADENGQVKAIKVNEIAWRPFGNGFDIIPNTEKIIPCDLALLAIGFMHPQAEGMLADLQVTLDERGNVKTENYATSAKGVFAAGDMRRGQSLVVWAIAEGRDCAGKVDEFLRS